MAKSGKFMKIMWGPSSEKMDIKAFAKELQSMLPSAESIAEKMEEALDKVEETAMELVPEDTGATKKSFFRRVEIKDGVVTGTAGFNEGNELGYVGLIHEGYFSKEQFKKPSAEPFFLSKAFTRNRDEINRILQKVKNG